MPLVRATALQFRSLSSLPIACEDAFGGPTFPSYDNNSHLATFLFLILENSSCTYHHLLLPERFPWFPCYDINMSDPSLYEYASPLEGWKNLEPLPT